jgi:membrane-associated phospholipid phosphatase
VARRTAPALVVAALCAAFAALVWVLAFHSGAGISADHAALRGFGALDDLHLHPLAEAIARLCDPLPYAVLCLGVLAHTYRTRGPRGVLAALAILAAANGLTHVLKELAAQPRPVFDMHVLAASWPSGHATAAMALALCATIAARPEARRLTAIAGGLFAVGVADSVVLLGWHFPSDVLGGFAVAGAATGLVVAATAWAEARWPAGTGRRALQGRATVAVWWPGVAAGIGVAAVLIAIAFGYITSVYGTRTEGPAFVVCAAVIAGLGFALAAAGSTVPAES